MPTTRENAAYILTIIEEPQEEPIFLTQQEFEAIITLGITLSPEEEQQEIPENLIEGSAVDEDFASLEAVNTAEGYILDGKTLDPQKCQFYFERALHQIIDDAVKQTPDTYAAKQ